MVFKRYFGLAILASFACLTKAAAYIPSTASLDADSLFGRSESSLWERQMTTMVPNTAPGLLVSSGTVESPAKNSTFRFDGHLFNFTYNGVGGTTYHSTGCQVQITTEGLGDGVRGAGMPETFNGYARTTQATVANIFPNAYQANTSQYETQHNLYNRYEYTLQAPKIPEWQRDLPGYLVIIEFYSAPNVSEMRILRRKIGEWLTHMCFYTYVLLLLHPPKDTDLVWSNVVYYPLQLISSMPT